VRVVVVGCGRVGAGLAAGLAEAGDVVAVVDKDPKAFERLGEEFTGQTVEGIGFDRDMLEQAGVARADALVAVTGGDNSNVVTARVARDAYRVPRVIARIHDPRRASLYEELGIVTVSSTAWGMRKVRDYLEHRTLKEEHSFGRGEVTLLRLELPQHLVDRQVADVEGDGLRVVSVTRRGGAFVPGSGTVLAEGDVVRLAVGSTAANGSTPSWPRRPTASRPAGRWPGEGPEGSGAPQGGAPVRVLLAGAGVWGSYIADHLVETGHEVVVVEQDAATARRARASGGRTVVAGDACEPSVLDRLGLDTVDTVVAATGDDEDNLVVSLLVKRWYGVPRVVARVNNPKNTWMFTDDRGADTAVSAPAVMTWLLERAVGVQDVVALLRAERGRGVALVELTLDEDAPVLGRRPAELDLPAGATVVAVVRGDQVLAGADAGPFEPADEVLALTTLQAEPDLRLLLGGQPGGSHTPAG
jgi:trk system potassium uptake protein